MSVRCIFLGDPQRRFRLFARMGRGGAMERFISACRNPLAKSATTKAIGYATQVPNASAKVLLFWHLANSCPGIENGMSGPLLQRIRFPFANRRRETQKLQVSKIQNFASTRWKQLQVRGGCKINFLIPAFL